MCCHQPRDAGAVATQLQCQGIQATAAQSAYAWRYRPTGNNHRLLLVPQTTYPQAVELLVGCYLCAGWLLLYSCKQLVWRLATAAGTTVLSVTGLGVSAERVLEW
jgi:hypothetical protein